MFCSGVGVWASILVCSRHAPAPIDSRDRPASCRFCPRLRNSDPRSSLWREKVRTRIYKISVTNLISSQDCSRTRILLPRNCGVFPVASWSVLSCAFPLFRRVAFLPWRPVPNGQMHFRARFWRMPCASFWNQILEFVCFSVASRLFRKIPWGLHGRNYRSLGVYRVLVFDVSAL